MNMQHVVKAVGAVHPIKRVNTGHNIEISFYGRPAVYWPGRAVVVRNPVDGKFLALKTR